MKHLCLHSNILHAMNQLRHKSSCCDVTLITNDDVEYPVHSVVVAAWEANISNQLTSYSKLRGNRDDRDVIQCHISSVGLRDTLEFLYGSLPRNPEEKTNVITGLRHFGIQNSACDFIPENITSTAGASPGEEGPCILSKEHEFNISDAQTDGEYEDDFVNADNSISCSADEQVSCPKNKKPDLDKTKISKTKSKKKQLLKERKSSFSDHKKPVHSDSVHAGCDKVSGKKRSVAKPKLVCKLCSREFRNAAHLDGHMNTHTARKPYTCQQCQRAFSYSVSLTRHTRKCQGVLKPQTWSCGVCSKEFISKRMHRQHMRTHKAPRFSCGACRRMFVSEVRLESHARSAHGSGEMCPICGKMLQSEAGYNQHVQAHQNTYRYKCESCDQGFHNNQHYQGHINKHQGRRPYMCSSCGVRFGYQQVLRNHERRCQSKASKKFLCKTNEAPKCDLCGLVFKNRHSLQGHKRGKHGQQSSQCLRCGSSFRWRQSYNRHVALCTGPKEDDSAHRVYPCIECGLKFKSESARREHMQAKHEEPRYQCRTCSIKFSWKSQYYRHRRSCSQKKETDTEVTLHTVRKESLPETATTSEYETRTEGTLTLNDLTSPTNKNKLSQSTHSQIIIYNNPLPGGNDLQGGSIVFSQNSLINQSGVSTQSRTLAFQEDGLGPNSPTSDQHHGELDLQSCNLDPQNNNLDPEAIPTTQELTAVQLPTHISLELLPPEGPYTHFFT